MIHDIAFTLIAYDILYLQSESGDYISICSVNMALVYLLQGHVSEAITWGNNALDEAKNCYDIMSQEVYIANTFLNETDYLISFIF